MSGQWVGKLPAPHSPAEIADLSRERGGCLAPGPPLVQQEPDPSDEEEAQDEPPIPPARVQNARLKQSPIGAMHYSRDTSGAT